MESKILATMLIGMLMLTSIAFADETQGDISQRPDKDYRERFANFSYRPLYANGQDINVADNLREKLKNAKENYLLKQKRYGVLKDNYQNAINNKTDFLSKLKSNSESFRAASGQDKNYFASELKSNSQSVLLNQVEAILNRLEAIKDNVNAPENVGELIEFFEEKKTELEGELTQEELRQISKEIKEFWNKKNPSLKKRIGEKLNAHIKGITNKAETFSKRISSLIEKLSDQGKDTSKLENGLEKLNSDLNRFNTAYAKVKEALSVESKDNVEQVLKKTHNLLRVMNKQLIKDFKLMKALFKATRELNEGEITSETIEELDEALNEPALELDNAIDELETALEGL